MAVEELVAGDVAAKPLPKPFHRVELGGIRGKRFAADIVRNAQTLGAVPAGPIPDEQDALVRIGRGQFLQVDVHGGGVDPRQKQREGFPVVGRNGAVDVEILIARFHQGLRPHASAGPVAAQRGLEPEATLVEEEHARLGVGQVGLRDLSDFF